MNCGDMGCSKRTQEEVVDELFFISEVKMKEADIEVVDLEQDNEETAEDKDVNAVVEDTKVEETQEGGANV